MPSCDMCGTKGKLFRTIVEGTEMMLCKECSRFGKVIAAPAIVMKREPITSKKQQKPEIIEMVVADYSSIIKEKRQKLGLKQEELAKNLNEKESIVNKMEAGKFEPSIPLARKLEQFLKVKLVQTVDDEQSVAAGKKSGPVTIGDIIQIRKKSK